MTQEFRGQHGNHQEPAADQETLVQTLSDAVKRSDRETLVQVLTEALEQSDEDALMQDLADSMEASAEELSAGSQHPGGPKEAERKFEPFELLVYIGGKIKYVILAALLGALLAGLCERYFVTPQYEATSKLYIVNSSGVMISLSDLQVASTLTHDYQEIFKTWELHEMVRSSLELPYTDGEFQSMLTVSNPTDTHLLYITIRHPEPVRAMQIANAYARAARTFIYQVIEGTEPTEFSIALVPSTSASMSQDYYMLIGLLAGMALSTGVLLLIFFMDERPRTPDDIAAMAGIPTLAVVPLEKRRDAGTKRRTVRRE